MLSLIKPRDLSFESVADFRYDSVSSILMPASKILIGSQGKLEDAALYENGNLTFSFANGTGDNGLDSGAEVPNQWYALYAVPKAGTSQYILKASTISPHAAGGSGPIGFSKYRYLGIFRNGVNVYNSTSSHLPGDICLFRKNKNIMNFTGFNDNGGGLYPQATRHCGVTLFIANTALNSVVLDTNNAGYIGFTGNSPSGAAKLPYKDGLFGFKHYMNSAANSAILLVTDSSLNDRNSFAMTVESVLNSFTVYVDLQFHPVDYYSTIRSVHAANLNINRGLLLQRFVDPFTVGGI